MIRFYFTFNFNKKTMADIVLSEQERKQLDDFQLGKNNKFSDYNFSKLENSLRYSDSIYRRVIIDLSNRMENLEKEVADNNNKCNNMIKNLIVSNICCLISIGILILANRFK